MNILNDKAYLLQHSPLKVRKFDWHCKMEMTIANQIFVGQARRTRSTTFDFRGHIRSSLTEVNSFSIYSKVPQNLTATDHQRR